MKNTIKLLAIVLLVFTFNSCDKVEELADIDINTTITEKITVHIDQNQETINQNVTLSLDNSDTHDYLNKIKQVSITKLTYNIIEFTGDENGTINVDFLVDNVMLIQENIIVKQADDNQTIFEVTDVNKLNIIANALKNNHQISTSVSGSTIALDDVMDFKINVTIDLNIVANPL